MADLSAAFLVLLSQAPVQSATSLLDEPGRMPARLAALAKWADGRVLCEGDTKVAQAREFKRRFGNRVLKLARVIFARGHREQWSREQTQLHANYRECVSAEQRTLVRSLNDFDVELTKMEDINGLGPKSINITICEFSQNPQIYMNKRVKISGALNFRHRFFLEGGQACNFMVPVWWGDMSLYELWGQQPKPGETFRVIAKGRVQNHTHEGNAPPPVHTWLGPYIYAESVERSRDR